ncbi:DUF4166 domain-containing protein [Jannaschia sp. S6380]|uniref:SDR family oxidoreductase n=1 Tax=Jannaschia sp. S6380 TaxID=2926408 RepID=UPI001FF4D6C0|nr:SDR family oxidoreductase [Jannaschia sp. S6380]MCK0167902.1 DUF4166 domain-containing protein [Jannaschia sp. S6380]
MTASRDVRILLIGGTGVFGSRLATGLRKMPGLTVVAAGRGPANDVRLDRAAPDLATRIAAQTPDIVIDAAGPFQTYGADPYAVARAAIDAGAHYLDLSDDAAFTAGIATLDPAARAAGVAAISGVSSVPALSSAAVEALRADLTDIHLIESVILPGNRAPRGLSVMRAILAQAGRPVTIWRAGRPQDVAGWGDLRRIRLPGLGPRWTSVIGAPDLALFPDRYGARTVTFRAGLEMSLLHLGLWALSLPVRTGLIRSLEPAARPMRRVADLFEPFGTDRGGMRVRVIGRGPKGAVRRDWTLLAEAGDGPHIPALPGRIMVAKLLAGQVAPGARACLGEFTLAEARDKSADLALTFATDEASITPVFARALGPAHAELPPSVRDLHDVLHRRRWSGTASVERGTGLVARLICAIMRFPPAAGRVPVTVDKHRHGDTENWTRDFGGRRFRSHLRADTRPGCVTERFGALTFRIRLTPTAEGLAYPVEAGRLGPIPIPRALLPRSDTLEAAEGQAATFDVALSMPFVGPLVRYRGRIASVG